MKRECLLSRTYTGAPMSFRGEELVYSAIVNEILREFKTTFFSEHSLSDQTQTHGCYEAIMIMHLVGESDFSTIQTLREKTREDRHKDVLSFAVKNMDQIDEIIPQLVARVESIAAAAVESEGRGKYQAQARDCLPS